MEKEYRDKDGKSLTQEEVHTLPPEELGARSGITVNIVPDTQAP